MKALDDLSDRPQWVAYTASKVPIGPDGTAASSTDPNTWMTKDEAFAVARRHDLAGIGFVMSNDDDFVGVDLDNAVDESGRVKPWAYDIVRELDSYTELSPSGRGLHIWVRGKLPAGGSRKNVEDGKLEVYESARYFTVTGNHIEGTREDIYDWGPGISQWYFHHFPSRPPAQAEPRPFDASDWLQDALNHIPADDYDVWTQVGMGLKSELGEAGFELWRQWSMCSPKYDGDERTWRKWRSFRGEGYTIGTVKMYAQQNGWTMPRTSADDILPGTDAFWDSYTLEGEEPEPDPFPWVHQARDLFQLKSTRQYIIEPKIAGASDTVVMAGPPKSMKSFITLDMLIHFGRGESWHGICPGTVNGEPRKLRSLVLNLELHHEAVAERIQLLKARDEDGNVYVTNRLRGRLGSRGIDELEKLAQHVGGFDILVVDPIANWFAGDSENDNAEMVQFLAELTELRRRVGEETVLWLVHHTRKAAASELAENPFNAFRGASSIRGYYDTGMAVWRRKDESLEMAFELRNGRAPGRLKLHFEKGQFAAPKVEGLDYWRGCTHGVLNHIEALIHEHSPPNKSQLALLAVEHIGEVTDRAWRDRLDALIVEGRIQETSGGLKWV